MPCSVTDRLNNTYEHIFHFVKNKEYYYDLDAIRVPPKNGFDYIKKLSDKDDIKFGKNPGDCIYIGKSYSDIWEVLVRPFPEAHFAVYPPELVELPLKSSCPKQICKKCGKPRERIVENIDVLDEEEKEKLKEQRERQQGYIDKTKGDSAIGSRGCVPDANLIPVIHKTTGWTDCNCGVGFTPGIVLDPFMGSGTTGLVAKRLGYRYIGFEVNPEYCKMANKRINKYSRTYDFESEIKSSIDDIDINFEVTSYEEFSKPTIKKKKLPPKGELSFDDFLGENTQEMDLEEKNPLDERGIKTKTLKEEEENEDIWMI